ncbi:hypothetical protein M0R45_019723 [Rubus argutus]|uniref:F-box domain-containing protein n=1 Tax=Rubus argutus TaxID=59490 RepID=A0AAW1X8N3_RUBAR
MERHEGSIAEGERSSVLPGMQQYVIEGIGLRFENLEKYVRVYGSLTASDGALAPPPCFMDLPPELKTKIFQSLPGVDVAKVECVCKELRKLGNNNELWNHKVGQEFPLAHEWSKKRDVLEGQRIEWKMVFPREWKRQHTRKVLIRRASKRLRFENLRI